MESGTEMLFNEPFHLPAVIEDAIYSYRSEAERRSIEFNLEIGEIPEMVVGDSRKIRTVVQNLTSNACESVACSSEITGLNRQ